VRKASSMLEKLLSVAKAATLILPISSLGCASALKILEAA
jgi:hypothetical protein